MDDAAARLRRTADALQAAYDGIRRVAASDASCMGEDSRAIDAFREVADDVAGKLIKAKPRYDTAAEALSTYAGELEGAQRESVGALRDAEQAQADKRREEATPPEQPPPPGTPSPADEALDRALVRLERAVTARDAAAGSAESKIHNRIEHDEVKDSIWDNLSKVGDVLSNVSTVLGVLALVVNVIPVIGQALSVIFGVLALITGALALIIHLGVALDNGEGWDAVVFDAIGVATFGVGRVLSAGAKTAGLAARTTAWSKLSRMGGSTAGRLSSGGYGFASKGPMAKSAAAVVARSGPLAGRSPFVVAGGPRTIGRELGEAWTTVKQGGWSGAWQNLEDVPGHVGTWTSKSPGDLSRLLQGEAEVSDALAGIRGIGDFGTLPAVSTALRLSRQSSTWAKWSHASFLTGITGTALDNLHVDIPGLP